MSKLTEYQAINVPDDFVIFFVVLMCYMLWTIAVYFTK